jgi:hypothetical protein
MGAVVSVNVLCVRGAAAILAHCSCSVCDRTSRGVLAAFSASLAWMFAGNS